MRAEIRKQDRTILVEAEELRVEGDGMLVGYASIFNSLSEDLGGFREIVRPGAFTATIGGNPNIRALWNHNSQYVLGRTGAGTLRLSEDQRGLRAEIDAPDTQWARDLRESIRRRDVTQMSFGFSVVKDNWRDDSNDTGQLRELLEVRLFEVSPVTFPAYHGTEINARGIAWIDRDELKPAHGCDGTDGGKAEDPDGNGHQSSDLERERAHKRAAAKLKLLEGFNNGNHEVARAPGETGKRCPGDSCE